MRGVALTPRRGPSERGGARRRVHGGNGQEREQKAKASAHPPYIGAARLFERVKWPSPKMGARRGATGTRVSGSGDTGARRGRRARAPRASRERGRQVRTPARERSAPARSRGRAFAPGDFDGDGTTTISIAPTRRAVSATRAAFSLVFRAVVSEMSCTSAPFHPSRISSASPVPFLRRAHPERRTAPSAAPALSPCGRSRGRRLLVVPGLVSREGGK